MPPPRSRRWSSPGEGRIWSYTDARYQPPPPYVAADPYVPFCLAAVELAAEKLVVMGQVVGGVTVDDLRWATRSSWWSTRSTPRTAATTWCGSGGRSAPPDARRGGLSVPDDKKVAVLGAGMHEWGKWGRPFVEYGLAAARDALADAGLGWRDMQFVSGADTIRNGYPGFVSGATFAQALGWTGARVSSVYAACASGAVAIANARAQILAGLCDVALVVGADTTPEGLLRPGRAASARTTRTGCASISWARPTRPTSRSTRAAAWTASARPRRTSHRSR